MAMIRHLILYTLLLILPIGLWSQAQIPLPDDTLNYTQVLFRWESEPADHQYRFSLWEVEGEKVGELPLLALTTDLNELIVPELEFGKTYRWLAVPVQKSMQNLPEMQSFHIANSPKVDPQKIRMRLTGHADTSYFGPNAVLTLDYAEIMVDRKGNPVWYLPKLPGEIRKGALLRDLRLTSEGSLTFVYQREGAWETDLKGNVLWEGPNDGQISDRGNEEYHHVFEKLSNGNYLVLGQEYEEKQLPGNDKPLKAQFGTILEYDPAGKVVWSWRSRDYFQDADLCPPAPGRKGCSGRTHMNAAFYDQKNEHIYAGFRDISRIIRIDKASGQVVNSWGDKMGSGQAFHGQGLIKRQHCSELLPDGNILVLNNDSVMDSNKVSSVRIFSQGIPGKVAPELVWEFPLDFDSLTDGRSLRTGNALLLPEGNFLVNAGQINRVFVVSPEKEILWDGFLEKSEGKGKWSTYPTYRSFFAENLHGIDYSARIRFPRKRKGKKSKREKLELLIQNQTSNPLTINTSSADKSVKKLPKSVFIPANSQVSLPFTVKRNEAGKLSPEFKICLEKSDSPAQKTCLSP